MSRMIVTHAVKDVEQWLAYREQTIAAFAPFATDIFFCTIPDGDNNVAISLNVHDMDGMMAMTETAEHQALVAKAGVIHPPHAVYMEAAA